MSCTASWMLPVSCKHIVYFKELWGFWEAANKLWFSDKPSDSAAQHKQMKDVLQHSGATQTQLPGWYSMQYLFCYFFQSQSLPFFTSLYYTMQRRSSTETPPEREVCDLLLLMRAAAHTLGWYLRSPDSQLLVWFYMQLKPKSRHLSPSVHMWFWLFSFYQMPAVFNFPILSQGGSFHHWSCCQHRLNNTPLLSQVQESHDRLN